MMCKKTVEDVSTQISMKLSRCEEQGEQRLLPGLPDEVTLDHIASKLPWRAMHVLPVVSRGWQQAIQRRQVYDATVRLRSTETLVVVGVKHKAGPQLRFIALYSMREKSFCVLPSFSQIDEGFQCVSLDGRIYILGGRSRQDPAGSKLFQGGGDVYELDLAAGQLKWTKCASMLIPRQCFGCGVKNGKIYVFGGISAGRHVASSEVYDPKANAWSPIMPMKSLRLVHDVSAVGEVLCVHDGVYSRSDPKGQHELNFGTIHLASFLELYHPGRDEWKVVHKPFGKSDQQNLFVAEGRLYSMTKDGINVFDTVRGKTRCLHSFILELLGPVGYKDVRIGPILFVNGELLLLMHWYERDSRTHGTSLLHSRGFGSQSYELEWFEIDCFRPSFDVCLYYSMHIVQL